MSGEIEVRMSAHGKGQVFIDGVKLPNVTGVKFETETLGRNKLTIEVLPRVFVLTGQSRVSVHFPRGVVAWEADE